MTFPPLHPVTRTSTDSLACEDLAVKTALQWIHEHATEGIQVDQVAQRTGVSRRQLERLFQTELHRTILSTIHEAKVAAAKQLLLGSNLRIAEIAERTGFTDVKRLNLTFKKLTDLSPSEYRKQLR